MKTSEPDTADDLRPEYDLKELLKGGVRGKYAKKYAAGSNVILLEPDILREFRDGKAVNDALRLVIELRRLGKGQPAIRGGS